MSAPRLLPTPELDDLVAVHTERGEVSHAAFVSSVFPDDARGDDIRLRTLRGLCAHARYWVGTCGELAFDPDASHHGWRRTCQRCAREAKQRQAVPA